MEVDSISVEGMNPGPEHNARCFGEQRVSGLE